MNPQNNKNSGFTMYILFVLLLAAIIVGVNLISNQKEEYSREEFIEDMEKGYVTMVEITPNSETPTGTLLVDTTIKGVKRLYVTDVIEAEQLVREHGIAPVINDVKRQSWVTTSLLPMLIVLGVGFLLLMFFTAQNNAQASAGSNKMLNFGKSSAKMTRGNNKTNFSKVAGLKEEKEEMAEIVDFLKDPGKYSKLGARIPKGVLLEGPPGTGKTLLAKAVAGEADVPFFSISGSDFVEMFVGVGAARVRDMFATAKKNAPCIVFIDEIDAIGRSRDSKYGGGNEEREQTLNQLLSEMDGFDSSKGVLILAATNRPEILDKALLRPGRFDRRIIVDKPDLKGRVEILKVHAKDVKMDDTVDLDAIALATSGACVFQLRMH